jgi:hypothetical protein
MTTNETVLIQIQLDNDKKKDLNIEIDSTMDTSVNYLDVFIINENGQLRTSVYHKPTSEPYYLPYQSDHPHKYHRNIPYSALIRAARLCSHVHDFNFERQRIELSLLLGQYPPKLISDQFLRFFQVHNAMSVFKELAQYDYEDLHQRLLKKPTRKQKKLTEQLKDPVKYPPILEKKPWDRSVMYLRYPFESGPMVNFSRQFHSWWKQHYQYPASPVKQVKIRLIPRTNSTLARSFIHKKPSKEMLTLMEQSNV